MKLAIITGTSKGLGESIAALFLQSGIQVIGISRSDNENLKEVAAKNKITYEHIAYDLGNTTNLEDTLQAIIEAISIKNVSKIYLINNAAVLDPIDQAMNISSKDLAYHVQVNTIAPMILMNFFLKKAYVNNFTLIGATVTSGAATRPVFGWSAYCSTKASMNIYTETVALEQDELGTGNKIIAFSPGIMDTTMQEKIRSSSHDAFIDVDIFKKYKEENHLKDTTTVGKVLVDILLNETTIINGKIYHVTDYL